MHNDYSIHGKWFTFWLMTFEDERTGTTLAFKGEGENDDAALDDIRIAFMDYMLGTYGVIPLFDSKSWPPIGV